MSQPYKEKTGKLIDTWIRLRRKIDGYTKSVTEYINVELAEKAGLSGRQIERMRRYDGYPEDKSIIKLVSAIPDLKSLDCMNFVERLLLPFSVVEQAQDRIKSPPKDEFNTIVIIAGWLKPLGIEKESISQATTKNISRGFKYIFLYPDPQTFPYLEVEKGQTEEQYKKKVLEETEKWINAFRRQCAASKNNELSKEVEDWDELDIRVKDFRDLLVKRIERQHSNNESSKFWFLLPSNYTVLYNPDKPKGSGFDRYGTFQVKGKPVELTEENLKKEETDLNFVNASEGWLYIEEKLFEDLAQLYCKLEKPKH
jgi:hypothetical protein